jgi:hypothetical protein
MRGGLSESKAQKGRKRRVAPDIGDPRRPYSIINRWSVQFSTAANTGWFVRVRCATLYVQPF